VSHNLAEWCNHSRIFGALGLSYEFLFTTARTLGHHECILASSSNIQQCLGTHDYPTLLSMRKKLMLFYHVSGNVLILEVNLQWWFLLSTCYLHRLFFALQPLLSLSMLKHYDILSIDILVMVTPNFQSWAYSTWSCSQPFEKNKYINKYVPSWACICISCAFGNLGWTNVHSHGNFPTHTYPSYVDDVAIP
jgi:hypothetical protein